MTDHFLTFGIGRTFTVDRERLEKRFHALQSASHPDRHVAEETERRERALAESSDINAAYRVLRDPIARAKHLVELYGLPISNQKSVSPALLMMVMDAQERIAEFESAVGRAGKENAGRELSRIVQQLDDEREATDGKREQLARKWDIAIHEDGQVSPEERELLTRVVQLLSERAYLETIHLSVNAARMGKPAFIQH